LTTKFLEAFTIESEK
jgi:hypothetical protein